MPRRGQTKASAHQGVPYPFVGNGIYTLKRMYDGTLTKDVWMEQWCFAKGSSYKAFETENFGWVVFGKDARLTNGAEPIRRIFKF